MPPRNSFYHLVLCSVILILLVFYLLLLLLGWPQSLRTCIVDTFAYPCNGSLCNDNTQNLLIDIHLLCESVYNIFCTSSYSYRTLFDVHTQDIFGTLMVYFCNRTLCFYLSLRVFLDMMVFHFLLDVIVRVSFYYLLLSFYYL